MKEYGLTDEKLHYIQLDEAAAANIDTENGHRLHLQIETAVLSNPLSLSVWGDGVVISYTFESTYILYCDVARVLSILPLFGEMCVQCSVSNHHFRCHCVECDLSLLCLFVFSV